MIVTNMPTQLGKPSLRLHRHPWRTLSALALLAIAPKCLLCLLAWLGLAATFSLGGVELCGAP